MKKKQSGITQINTFKFETFYSSTTERNDLMQENYLMQEFNVKSLLYR